MPAAEAVGPHGYVPVPMRTVVDAEEALAFISAPTGASGVVRHGAGMEGIAATTPPQSEMDAGSSICAERRFGRLFERVIAAISRRDGLWDPSGLGLAPALPRGVRTDPVVVASSSNEEAPSVVRR
ncbi:hypothetical protein VPH35_138282 [Triticum aestivum]